MSELRPDRTVRRQIPADRGIGGPAIRPATPGGISRQQLDALDALNDKGPDLVLIFCTACRSNNRNRQSDPAARVSRRPQGLLLHSARHSDGAPRDWQTKLNLLLDALDPSELGKQAVIGCVRHGRLQPMTFNALLESARAATPGHPTRHGVAPLPAAG